jgi:hypothetical protein
MVVLHPTRGSNVSGRDGSVRDARPRHGGSWRLGGMGTRSRSRGLDARRGLCRHLTLHLARLHLARLRDGRGIRAAVWRADGHGVRLGHRGRGRRRYERTRRENRRASGT